MCGIAGFTDFHQRLTDAAGVLARMLDTLIPRGPDGQGAHLVPPVALGHRRLSIIDPAGGTQPMSTADKRHWLVCNGEIYNYLELRRELEARGAVFATQSDTEVLLRQLAPDPARGLTALNGMFALALWDAARQELFLARDRVGIKPLYYCPLDGDLIFASELKALLRHPGVARRIDVAALDQYFAYGYIPAPASIYEGIFKLEPGHYLVHGVAGARQAAYWDVPCRSAAEADPDECAAQLRDRLCAAVRLQLRSDVPVGVLLSGGIDSSVITAIAARESARPVHTFSLGFEEASYDESPYARAVARYCRTQHQHEILSARRAAEELPQALGVMDEPLGDASILPTWFLARCARHTVKVVLGGDGGDELFAGYPAFQAHFLMERFLRLPPAARARLIRLAARLPVSHRYASAEYHLRRFFQGAGCSPAVRFFLWMGAFSRDECRALYAPALRERLRDCDPFDHLARLTARHRGPDELDLLLYLCLKVYLQDGVLVKVDRASMAHSLEARVPLLDHSLVEFAAGISPRLKLRGWTTKWILKRAVREWLPARIIRRRKAGFMIPLAGWLAGPLRPLVEDCCAPAALARDAYVDPVAVRRLLDEHYTGRGDHRKRIWSLLAFQFWRQHQGV